MIVFKFSLESYTFREDSGGEYSGKEDAGCENSGRRIPDESILRRRPRPFYIAGEDSRPENSGREDAKVNILEEEDENSGRVEEKYAGG
ncbi:hypothetical protein CEXT_574151 [Caerostris extrusa]|uniref:Uncharacterized protein n=1 Tax=Caerostris extrusa TaxID=172846 RepID=A0AAV4VX09_CAEEX|nr:hypothetical protein CEXT_574151 [Caerostris extrusa]